MYMKTKTKMLIPCLLIAVLIMFLSIPRAYADGIFNNGLYGISIDIYSTPYSTTYAERGQSVGTDVVYGYYGCGWFASARVNQLTGKDVPLSNGVGWWKNAENLGFSKGYTAPTSGNALICYKKKINSDGTEFAHVEVIEGFSGDKVIISMGGDSEHPGNGYCSIGLYDKSHLSNSDIEGFVYLQRPEGEMLTSGFNRVIPDGDYVIVNTGNSDSDRSKFYYLDIEGGETTAANGANVYLQGPISSVPPACDIWSVTYNSSDKFYTIKQKGTNMCLDAVVNKNWTRNLKD